MYQGLRIILLKSTFFPVIWFRRFPRTFNKVLNTRPFNLTSQMQVIYASIALWKKRFCSTSLMSGENVILWINKNLHGCQFSLLFLYLEATPVLNFLVKWSLSLSSQGTEDTTYISPMVILSFRDMQLPPCWNVRWKSFSNHSLYMGVFYQICFILRRCINWD